MRSLELLLDYICKSIPLVFMRFVMCNNPYFICFLLESRNNYSIYFEANWAIWTRRGSIRVVGLLKEVTLVVLVIIVSTYQLYAIHFYLLYFCCDQYMAMRTPLLTWALKTMLPINERPIKWRLLQNREDI